jgi:hypothetical protein
VREQNVISEQTVISAEETKELIERLNDPSFRASQNQTTVKDLAETLDIDPTQIAGYLQSLREEKQVKTTPVPEVVPSQSFVSPGNLQYRKLAYVMIFTALVFTVLMFFLSAPSTSMIAPEAPKPVVQAVPDSQRGPTPDAPVAR